MTDVKDNIWENPFREEAANCGREGSPGPRTQFRLLSACGRPANSSQVFLSTLFKNKAALTS